MEMTLYYYSKFTVDRRAKLYKKIVIKKLALTKTVILYHSRHHPVGYFSVIPLNQRTTF